MNRRRLDFEAWRDSILQVSGKLEAAIGGAPVDFAAEKNVRRTLYGKIHRRDLDVMLRLHDFPDPTAHSPKRAETNTPLQALFALNGEFVQQQAAALADAVSGGSPEEKITDAYRRVLQRDPTARELELGEKFLASGKDMKSIWVDYAQVLLSSNEFLFLD